MEHLQENCHLHRALRVAQYRTLLYYAEPTDGYILLRFTSCEILFADTVDAGIMHIFSLACMCVSSYFSIAGSNFQAPTSPSQELGGIWI